MVINVIRKKITASSDVPINVYTPRATSPAASNFRLAPSPPSTVLRYPMTLKATYQTIATAINTSRYVGSNLSACLSGK
jgi:hypothetical protein